MLPTDGTTEYEIADDAAEADVTEADVTEEEAPAPAPAEHVEPEPLDLYGAFTSAANEGTKKWLEERLAYLEEQAYGFHAGMVAADEALAVELSANDAMRGLLAERDATISELKAVEATLNLTLTATQGALKVAQTTLEDERSKPKGPKTARLGTLRVSNGLAVLASATLIDQRWKTPSSARSTCVVDFAGPSAEYLAKRMAGQDRKVFELPDGVWRLTVPNENVARQVQDATVKWTRDNGDETVSTWSPAEATGLQALDQTRANGVGIVPIDGQPAVAAFRAASDDVRVDAVLNDGDEVVGVLVHLA